MFSPASFIKELYRVTCTLTMRGLLNMTRYYSLALSCHRSMVNIHRAHSVIFTLPNFLSSGALLIVKRQDFLTGLAFASHCPCFQLQWVTSMAINCLRRVSIQIQKRNRNLLCKSTVSLTIVSPLFRYSASVSYAAAREWWNDKLS